MTVGRPVLLSTDDTFGATLATVVEDDDRGVLHVGLERSCWGLRDDGTPYYEADGVAPGDEAVASLNPDTGAISLTRLTSSPQQKVRVVVDPSRLATDVPFLLNFDGSNFTPSKVVVPDPPPPPYVPPAILQARYWVGNSQPIADGYTVSLYWSDEVGDPLLGGLFAHPGAPVFLKHGVYAVTFYLSMNAGMSEGGNFSGGFYVDPGNQGPDFPFQATPNSPFVSGAAVWKVRDDESPVGLQVRNNDGGGRDLDPVGGNVWICKLA